MLLCNVVLFVDIALERREDVTLVKKVVSTSALEVQQGVICDAVRVRQSLAVLRRNGEVL